jgi:hypothetical protein
LNAEVSSPRSAAKLFSLFRAAVRPADASPAWAPA